MSGRVPLLVALALASARGVRGQVDSAPLTLPPFLVEETKSDGVDWIYGSADDIQVLSGCGTDQTAGFVEQIRSQRGNLLSFIPKGFLVHEILPLTVILYPKTLKPELDKAMRSELDEGGVASAGRFAPMNDLRLSDSDSSDIFIVFDDQLAKTDVWLRGGGRAHSFNYPAPVSSPAYLRFLLEARAPALPRWYVSGIVGLYSTMSFDADDASVHGARFGPDPWVSAEEASALNRHPETPRPLVPLGELFTANYPSGRPLEYRRVWEAEAELFVRWCYSGRVERGAEKLERFVEAATARPTTEEAFHQSFGMDYDDALEALSDYLPRAVGAAVFVSANSAPPAQPFDLHTATRGEVRRVKAEWSRRVVAAIRVDHPQEFPVFLGRERQSLEAAFAGGDRDPAFVSTLALFCIQNGEAKKGLALLESDRDAAATRPLAQLEVAEDAFGQVLQRPAGPGGKLSDEQASRVMALIAASVRRGPIEQAYAMAARVDSHLGREPSRAERAVLDDGARLFGRDSELVLQVASLDLRAGDYLAARDAVDRGVWEAADPGARRDLEKLRLLATRLTLKRSAQAGRAKN